MARRNKNKAEVESVRIKSFMDMIAPSVIKFFPDYFICGNTYRSVWALREYPTTTEEQAILKHLGEKDGVSLKIYTRHVTAAEERKIISNAANKNRLRQSKTNDLQETVVAEGNLQDVTNLVASMHRNREPLIHTAVYIEIMSHDIDKLKELQTEVLTELIRSKGYEILYCTEEIDEFTLQSLMTYKEKKFCSAMNDDLGIETEENKEDEENKDALLTFVKETLGDKVAEVTASKKLVSHPVCLTAKGGISFEMEKYFNSVQPDANMKAQRVLELNLSHPAVKKMEEFIKSDVDRAKKYAEVLYSQALLIAGLPLENPSEYTDLVCSIM